MASSDVGASAHDVPDQEKTQEKFSPEEEAEMVSASHAHKAEANALFTSGKYDAAINKYNEALAVCPIYLDYELAVLHSNVAACHLKLEEWKDAAANASSALTGLEKLEREAKEKDEAEEAKEKESEDVVELEIVSQGAKSAGPAVRNGATDAAETARRIRGEDIARIRAKALMRRARARSELGGWTNLEGALSDYKKLSEAPGSLGPADKKIVQTQLRALPRRVKEAQEKETAEMWGKLKELGNGLLKPFGLSTENFKMTQDPKTGGYSMNFEGGGANK